MRLADSAHRDIRRVHRFSEHRVVFSAHPRVCELAPQGGVVAGFSGRGPAESRAVLGARLTPRLRAEQVHQRLEVLRALVDLVGRYAADVVELAARLFAHLAAQSILDGLAFVDTPTGEQPCARVGAADLLHEEHAT